MNLSEASVNTMSEAMEYVPDEATLGVESHHRPTLAPKAALLPNRKGYLLGKRLLDMLGGAALLLVCFPLLLIVGILIMATSDGPVLFKQKRIGQSGREFWCFKFRTMVTNAEDVLKKNPQLQAQYEQEGFKLKNDPRITRVGAFLRKTSLDELPQFINVLKGEMSLIGPRPIVPSELVKYGEFAPKLLTVKPGIGGLWQASGRSDISYAERVALDMSYIDRCSLGLDIKLLFMTATSVIRSHGAY